MVTPQAKKWGNVKNMFALIIGIDNYSNVLPKLKGAVADADRFKSFLINEANVQKDRIITLRDTDATRERIVGAFRTLWESKYIQRDDPILIFYAGHGCEMPRPEDWEVGEQEMIQALCPCDMGQDSSSQPIYPIPDRTIAVWLNLLSYKKGHNITVILDCCHSAGATRIPEEGTRYLEFEGDFPRALEREFADALKIAGGVPLSYVNQHSRSHVLLAACSATESAKEVGGKGLFTTELLRALREEHGVDQLSFLEFTGRLRNLTKKNKILQTPQCYGHFKDRILFSNSLKLRSGMFPVSWEQETTYRIEAGLLHGVDEGSLFDGYEAATIESIASEPRYTLTARRVHPLYTLAALNQANVKLPEAPRVARQVRSGNLMKVHFTSAFRAAVNQDKVLRLQDFRRKVKVERDAASADFIIDIMAEKKEAAFITNLKAMTHHGFRRLPKSVPADPESVNRVLLAASRWKQYLEISCGSPLAKNIQIEFFQLETSFDDNNFVTKPKGKRLNAGNDLVYIDVKRNHNDFYGMKITNKTARNLHFSMLAFDIGDLDITSNVSGSVGVQSTGDADPALYSMKSLHIGYGNGGELPFVFRYPPGEVNITILKMYFTTSPMDLKWVEQATPFIASQDDRGMRRDEAAWRRLNASTALVGFTTSFTIVQRAHPWR